MKILVREIQNGICNYVWKKMKVDNTFAGSSYCTDDGCYYEPYKVIKITHDYRLSDYVKCGNCGKTVKRTRLIKHYEEQEHNANCLKCANLRLRPISDAKPVLKILPNGTVTQKTTNEAFCRVRYYEELPIGTINKAEKCKHFACRRSEAVELRKDFFANNPNPYNMLLSEKAVINAGWKFLCKSYNSGRVYSNKNGKLTAQFDTNGILEYFAVLYRSNSYIFTYSDVYDKFMSVDGNEFNWVYMAESAQNRYKKQIRALYK